MLYVGIDISKLTFDAAYSIKKRYVNKSFTNNAQGYAKFHSWINKPSHEVFTCLESTGIYGFGLAQYLSAQHVNVMVVNPIITHAFYKVELGRNKTDKADAQLIARYCEHIVLKGDFDKKSYQPKGADYEALQRLVTRCDQLEKTKTQESNRLEASIDADTSRSIKRLQKAIELEIIHVKKTIQKIVKKNKSLLEQVELLTSIPGIADKTAWSILAYIGDISFFDNSKQIASYSGLTPKITQSGSSVNRSSLSKMGHKRLRKSLYMPALSAKKHNDLLRVVYQRLLDNGKPKKVALVAVMRKLLVIAYGVLKSKKPFDLYYKPSNLNTNN